MMMMMMKRRNKSSVNHGKESRRSYHITHSIHRNNSDIWVVSFHYWFDY